jgi:hypothetical protein
MFPAGKRRRLLVELRSPYTITHFIICSLSRRESSFGSRACSLTRNRRVLISKHFT